MKAPLAKWSLTITLIAVANGLYGQGLIKFDNLATNSGVVSYYNVLLSQDVNMQLYGGPTFSTTKIIRTWLLSDNSASGINVAPGRFADPNGGVYAIPGVEAGEWAYLAIAAWVGNYKTFNDVAVAGAPYGVMAFRNPTGSAGSEPNLVAMPDWGLSALDFLPVVYAQIKITLGTNGETTLTWAVGTLVSAPNVDGPYTPVSGATSPYVVTPAATVFYRLKQ